MPSPFSSFAMDANVKQEIMDPLLRDRKPFPSPRPPSNASAVIELSSSGSDSDGAQGPRKKQRLGVALPPGFLEPLKPAPPSVALAARPVAPPAAENPLVKNSGVQSARQFWKAGDYEGDSCGDWEISSGGMDHVRVHPKFLHSNATSHKWALGAFAELLDNALDEVCNGATYVNMDVLVNKKDNSRMILVEDNGGGMDPDKMRQCMSLGYSAKSKLANTIGQYGNGFKTSTMRLGADVIVFSRCSGEARKGPTQSIGLLSYTFLKSTKKEDIVVPMLDYERKGSEWVKIVRTARSTVVDWTVNLETIVQWSPYIDEAELLQQFSTMKDHGTRIIIYNLWEDDEGQLELDFDADQHDIQLTGVNREEKNIQMAKQYPNSRHFLTYRNSLRSYVSILYLRLPPTFRIILRGRDVEHHNIVNDMMMTQEITYRPQPGSDGVPKDSNMYAVVTIGFVKDAKFHIDVQGFNVYHKNRLIKPFWRLWNPAGSDGRGVIGVLEANFVEPAHDKQGFERTTVLSRLETRLIQMQKTYWRDLCHHIGYSERRRKSVDGSEDREDSPEYLPETSSHHKRNSTTSSRKLRPSNSDKAGYTVRAKGFEKSPKTSSGTRGNGEMLSKAENKINTPLKSARRLSSSECSPPLVVDVDDEDHVPEEKADGNSVVPLAPRSGKVNAPTDRLSQIQQCEDTRVVELEEENRNLRERLKKMEEEVLADVIQDLQKERDRCESLEKQLDKATLKIGEMNKEQESLIEIFTEERERRDNEGETLRKKLKDASDTIQELRNKVILLEKMRPPNHKMGQ